MPISQRSLRWIASVLMILLGLARGVGGAILIRGGKGTLPDSPASPSTLLVVGLFLVAIGLVEVIAGLGVAARRRRFWALGIAATVAFVVDGAINGLLLFGRPGAGGTVVNLAVALVIFTCLVLSRHQARE